jgi:hypothetical protein
MLDGRRQRVFRNELQFFMVRPLGFIMGDADWSASDMMQSKAIKTREGGP